MKSWHSFNALQTRDSQPNIKIYEKNLSESPFLRLPAELRLYIYEFVLCGRVWQIRRDKNDFELPYFIKEKNAFSLLQVCRQIHDEAKHLPVKLGTFDPGDPDRNDLQAWLKMKMTRMTQHSQEITSIQLSRHTMVVNGLTGHVACLPLWLKEPASLENFPRLKYVHIRVLNFWVPNGHPRKCRDAILERKLDNVLQKTRQLNPGVKVSMALLDRDKGTVHRVWKAQGQV